ncbi:uncharacterized protein [Neodiprion pinetum]|uniref:uncharacterized protein n=1 Tax=Neodiprion pinetum TaxID=441929 RepID=UPI0037161B20
MSKDKSLLSGVSKLFTEQTLEDIIRKTTGEKDVEILSWDFGEASKKGDGYLSIVDRVTVKGEAGGKPASVSLVVKSMPQNIGRRKTFRSKDFFYNEIICYTEIFPKFNDFLHSKGLADMIIVPRCLAAVTDGENDYLALEDVSILGFGPVTRQNTLNLSQCELILKALARFHAVSFAYKDQKKEEFQNLADKLLETYFTPELYKWYINFQGRLFKIAKDALAKEYPGSKAEEKFNSWSRRDFYFKSVDFCNKVSAATSVITQGDAWAPNFLIRQSDGDKHPTALALDFQLSRAASPVLDTSFFIYTCTEKSLRDDHYEHLLKTYHDEISRSISLLGSNPEKIYPWDLFRKEVQEYSLHGVNFAIEAVPFSLLDADEAFDLNIIKGDEAVDISDVWTIEPIKSKEGRRRLADTLVHAVENNFI